jgi:hypothetical protein
VTTPTEFPSPQRFQSVTEADAFLALFPHRYDYLRAEHPNPGDRPDWKTESKYPLSDRHLQQGTYLYGVRFGPLTRYLALDIDRHSAYHPRHDPFAIQNMLAALEVIGLVAYVAVRSSDSGGIHLYFPFAQEQKSWGIAQVVSTLLAQAGFKLTPGQLESFPNPRPYTVGTPSLYNGHRVPLQTGSYLLNAHWEAVYSDQAAFVQQWRWAERRNDLDHKTIKRVLKQTQRQQYKIVKSGGQKLLNDLHTEIEQGWTGAGQTNRLLGRIAMREYIFGHIQRGGTPLTGPALVDAIVEVAVALPGYEEWCRHQHEIQQLAGSWARSIEAAPKYYPYDPSKRVVQLAPQSELEPANNIVSFNQWQALDAEQRIKDAIATLQATNNLPLGVTARANAIIGIARCSKQTLNKHKALWHPAGSVESTVLTLVEPETAPSESTLLQTLEPLPAGSVHPVHPNKLVPSPAAPQGQAERQKEVRGSGGFSTGQVSQAVSLAVEPHDSDPKFKALSIDRSHALTTEQTVIAASGDSNPVLLPPQSSSAVCLSPVSGVVTNGPVAITQAQAEQQRQRERRQEKMAAQRQMWLDSGDPILVKEAQLWFKAQVERQNTAWSDS